CSIGVFSFWYSRQRPCLFHSPHLRWGINGLVHLEILEEDVPKLLAVEKSGEYLKQPGKESDTFLRKRNYLIVLLAVASGMRIGEIFGLTWPCVDVTTATIVVKHSLQNMPKNRVLKSTKTGKQRKIVVPKSVAVEIAEWREYQAAYAEKFKGFYKNKMDSVFTDQKGGLIGMTHFGICDYRAISDAASLSGTRFQDLRHFFASRALAHGVSVTAVSEQLGHSSINITLDRYTHVLEKSRDEMKAMLNANPLFKTGDAVDKESLEKHG
ncbi:MAG: site-specific integrase, partial [Paludibacteraceae bacterium]|nr:site-specific integrase [Paludibacteraceae bacterium]